MLARNGAGLVFTSGMEVIMGLERVADPSIRHTDPEKGNQTIKTNKQKTPTVQMASL